MIDPIEELEKLYSFLITEVENGGDVDVKQLVPILREARQMLQALFVMKNQMSKTDKYLMIEAETDKYDIRKIINKIPDELKLKVLEYIEE